MGIVLQVREIVPWFHTSIHNVDRGIMGCLLRVLSKVEFIIPLQMIGLVVRFLASRCERAADGERFDPSAFSKIEHEAGR